GTYFALIGHASGIGIYLGKMMELSDMFLNVGLYVWVGMMLKQTRLATLVFNVFRPWRMPPEMLAVVAVLVAAVPTAYTGASGIFVIAAGAVIYSELRAAGARRHLALAATAMSGSLGVVLRPCLLVVVIAYLNREVTTDELFGWGIWVFLLTATMFALVALSVNRQSQFNLAPSSEAFPAMLQALKPLVPYVLVIAAVVLFYRLALDVGVDEFSAPRLLPVIMLAILVYEHVRLKNRKGRASGEVNHQGLERSLRGATNDTTAEIGALLLLLGLSVSIGGVIERSHIMATFPQSFDSAWSAMLLMVVILVVLGMIMDAFGAVILVTATVATIAYASGIHPVHFWMVTLVAFELGYLSPPVALNHLLTRQVVGEAEVLAAQQETGTFYQRHERIIMPLIAMGISLVLVAFVPLLFYA
ncbi:MAG: TRAP transporter large permease subunit, partial [Pseudomonadota bacterium]|nr:TRAP transporter large permease subunit [Pseudomonadota bacterium]